MSNSRVVANSDRFLIILISPSGGGKSAILKKVLDASENIKYSVSYTTRKPRNNEIDGKSYHFVSEEKFSEMKGNKQFLETAKVHGFWYGTSYSFIKKELNKGSHIIMDIDYWGAQQILEKDIDTVTIFILPPSRKIWLQRLRKRGTEDEKTLQKRLQTAETELTKLGNFQYLVINDELDKAVEDVKKIIQVEEMKIRRNKDKIWRFNE